MEETVLPRALVVVLGVGDVELTEELVGAVVGEVVFCVVVVLVDVLV